jgi:intracellular septation protein
VSEDRTIDAKPAPDAAAAQDRVEMGPLVAFFIANAWGGIFWATGVYMVGAAVALPLSWAMTRRLAIVPIVTLGFVVAFGALTLLLADETFIKVKVSIINGCSAPSC